MGFFDGLWNLINASVPSYKSQMTQVENNIELLRAERQQVAANLETSRQVSEFGTKLQALKAANYGLQTRTYDFEVRTVDMINKLNAVSTPLGFEPVGTWTPTQPNEPEDNGDAGDTTTTTTGSGTTINYFINPDQPTPTSEAPDSAGVVNPQIYYIQKQNESGDSGLGSLMPLLMMMMMMSQFQGMSTIDKGSNRYPEGYY
jgi:hypothetical protein